MASDYDAIRADNITRRGTDFDDIGRLISEQLYSDRTHFVYELLQNAEDAGAKRVGFNLFHNRLEFRHFGGRPFDTKDVEAITDILRGTKLNDPGMIGKFGIGFKSVFGFTATPEIHCRDEHFQIQHYIQPYGIKAVLLSEGETFMSFPFNHMTILPETAYEQIAKRLQTLGPRVLLFLHHISAIDYEIEGSSLGMYKRASLSAGSPRRVELLGETLGQERPSLAEQWLLFERDSAIAPGRPNQIAYRITDDGSPERRQIVPTRDAPLSVSFPTEQHTDLGFLIDGPYATTPARDNIKRDSSDNHALVKETAELVVESLLSLRDSGLLSIGALEAMPLKPPDTLETYNKSFFLPIYEHVRQAFFNERLLPTGDGTFVRAGEGKLARGSELRELLSSDQLQTLFNVTKPVQWLTSDITEDRTPQLRNYVRSILGIEEATPELFAARFTGAFAEAQTDSWISQLYAFLDGQRALWRPPYRPGGVGGPLRTKPIIRLQDGRHVPPFDKDDAPLAFLPSSAATHFPVVRASLIGDPAALTFLRNLGLTEPDRGDEVIQYVLPKYDGQGDDAWWRTSTEEENLADLRKVLLALTQTQGPKRAVLYERVKTTTFLRCRSPADDNAWFCTPDEVYFGDDESLLHYFEGYPKAYFLVHGLTSRERELLMQLGVAGKVRVFQQEPAWNRHVVVLSQWGQHERGLSGFDPNCEIAGLENALQKITPSKASYIWNNLLIPNASQVRGIVEVSNRQDYSNSTRLEKASKLGELVTAEAWIPLADGQYHKPGEVSPEDLPPEFEPDERLIQALRLRPLIAPDVLDILGIGEDEARFIQENPDSFRQWVEEQRTAAESPRRGRTRSDTNHDEDTSFSIRLWEAQTSIPSTAGSVPSYLPTGGPETKQSARVDTTESLEVGRSGAQEQRSVSRWVPTEAAKALADRFKLMVEGDYSERCQICSRTFAMLNGEQHAFVVHLVEPSRDSATNHFGNLVSLCGWHYALVRYGQWTFVDPSTQERPDTPERQGEVIRSAPLKVDEMGNEYRCVAIRFWNVYSAWDAEPDIVDEEIRYSVPHWTYLEELLESDQG